MRIVFMGTPEYAVGALEALIQAGHEIAAVVTQPDKARGRSGSLQSPPVKLCAVKHGIPVLQPERVRRPEAVEQLRAFGAEVFVVAAFGQILSQELLDMPAYGCLNIHASLLPKYRGASPIQHVIIEGEEKTGITIMRMDAGIDTGDILYQKELGIERQDTYSSLYEKLTALGGESIVEALDLYAKGLLRSERQRDKDSSYARLITKEMGRVDFARDALSIERLIHAMDPWPSAYTSYRGKQLKLWDAVAQEGEPDAEPGTVVSVGKQDFAVATGQGVLQIRELQLEGKKRMSARDFLMGVRIAPGDRLGS
ncbi:MAG: methionyl-tRNA formyltransferase [bacterium]|nr:methionyl-tRNA formyltransferase [bacterium]MCM1376514.1 methionyl-tRNA formyltransferase [Muribaculum sp.]MCM1410834.1 methionyl-tRNA formyltransferase [Lachnospiraceae bacterium]